MYCDIITKSGSKFEFMIPNSGGYIKRARRMYGYIQEWIHVAERGGSTIFLQNPTKENFIKHCLKLAGGDDNVGLIETQGV